MDKQAMQEVRRFNELPFTEEKMGIQQRYLLSETTALEFYVEVARYLKAIED